MSFVDPSLPGIIVDPGGQTLPITIESPSGVTPTVYKDPNAVLTWSMPALISTATQFFLPSPGPWTVNGQTLTLEGAQVATVSLSSAAGQSLSSTGPYVQSLTLVTDGATDNAPRLQTMLGGETPTTGQQVVLEGLGVAVVNSPVILGTAQVLTGFGTEMIATGANMAGNPPGLAIVAGPSFSGAVPQWAQTLYGLGATVSSPVIFAGKYCGIQGIAVAGLGNASYSVYANNSFQFATNSCIWRATTTALFDSGSANGFNVLNSFVGNSDSNTNCFDSESSDWIVSGSRLTHGQKVFNGPHAIVSGCHLTSGSTTSDTGYNTVVSTPCQFDGVMFDSVPSGGTALIEDNVTIGYPIFTNCLYYQSNTSVTTLPIFHKVGSHAKIVTGGSVQVSGGSTWSSIDDVGFAGDVFNDIQGIVSGSFTNGITAALLFPGILPAVMPPVITGAARIWGGSGAPSFSAGAGDIYIRSGQTAGTRFYYNGTAGNNWAAATGV